ncbi:hypothetical protein [Nocardia tenerifensis]|nr:hypothetical protein [Nocardia tenerifensis]
MKVKDTNPASGEKPVKKKVVAPTRGFSFGCAASDRPAERCVRAEPVRPHEHGVDHAVLLWDFPLTEEIPTEVMNVNLPFGGIIEDFVLSGQYGVVSVPTKFGVGCVCYV